MPTLAAGDWGSGPGSEAGQRVTLGTPLGRAVRPSTSPPTLPGLLCFCDCPRVAWPSSPPPSPFLLLPGAGPAPADLPHSAQGMPAVRIWWKEQPWVGRQPCSGLHRARPHPAWRPPVLPRFRPALCRLSRPCSNLQMRKPTQRHQVLLCGHQAARWQSPRRRQRPEALLRAPATGEPGVYCGSPVLVSVAA